MRALRCHQCARGTSSASFPPFNFLGSSRFTQHNHQHHHHHCRRRCHPTSQPPPQPKIHAGARACATARVTIEKGAKQTPQKTLPKAQRASGQPPPPVPPKINKQTPPEQHTSESWEPRSSTRPSSHPDFSKLFALAPAAGKRAKPNRSTPPPISRRWTPDGAARAVACRAGAQPLPPFAGLLP